MLWTENVTFFSKIAHSYVYLVKYQTFYWGTLKDKTDKDLPVNST